MDIETIDLAEFSSTKDSFAKARKKGVRSWILSHLFHGSNKIIIGVVFFTTILASNINSLIYVYIGFALSEFIAGQISQIIYYTIIILVLAIVTPLLRLVNYILREVLAQRLERDTREEFYSNLLGKSQSFHDQQKIGEIMARASDDVRWLNFLISPAISLIFESFTSLIVPLVYIVLFYPLQLIIIPIIFQISFFIALRIFVKQIGPVSVDLRTNFGSMNAVLNETLSGIEVVKASAQEQKELSKYSVYVRKYRNAFARQGLIQARYLPLLFLAVTITLGLAHSIILYFNGLMDLGQIISYIGLIYLFRFPTFISVFVFSIIRVAIASSKRLLEFMNKKTEIGENLSGVSATIEGKIEFKNVSFQYPNSDKFVLKDVSFEILPGQTVAIVGTTGSGKSTLSKLISRLYDVSEGQILIDDRDVREYNLRSLRSQISYIEQDVFLFSDTIFYNITFGRVSSLEKAREISKLAQADEFIQAFPKAYDSEIGERGVQLSGGERQRIAIARAFLNNPQILILDDSTSAIDSNTEDKIQRAMKNIIQNRTTLLITHRLSQIRWADLILVLRDGEIAAKGSHEELLRTSPEYQKIFVKRFDVNVEQLLRRCD